MNKYLKKINRQEHRFITEYMKHGDRVLAWKKAYPKINVDEERIFGIATALMKAAHIHAELKQYLTESEIKYGLSKAMLINELKHIAFFDIKELFDDKGNVKSAAELKQAGKAITEILITSEEVGGIEVVQRKVKLANKLTAIDMLSKMMGYYEPDKVRVVDEEGNDVQPQLTVVFQKFANGALLEQHNISPVTEDVPHEEHSKNEEVKNQGRDQTSAEE